MTADQVIKIADKYYTELVKNGLIPAKFLEDLAIDLNKYPEDRLSVEAHVAWACTIIKSYAKAGAIEAAEQWLGFVQGALWVLGFYSIEEMRQHDVDPNGNGSMPSDPEA